VPKYKKNCFESYESVPNAEKVCQKLRNGFKIEKENKVWQKTKKI